jgi:hypothetical protein
LFQYTVSVSGDPQSFLGTAAYLCAALFPDGGPIPRNVGWRSVIFDGKSVLLSPKGNLPATLTVPSVPDVSISLSLARTISAETDLLALCRSAVRQSLLALGFCSSDGLYVREGETVSHNGEAFEFCYGFKPFLFRGEQGVCLCFDVESRVHRKTPLSEALAQVSPNRRSGLERAVRSVRFLTRPVGEQTCVSISRVLWDSSADRERMDRTLTLTVADYFARHFGHDCRPDDVVVEATDNCLFPSSFLTQFDLTEAEKRCRKLVNALRHQTALTAHLIKSKGESLVKALKTDQRSAQVLGNFGIEIGDPVGAVGTFIRRPPGDQLFVPPLVNKPPIVLCQDSLSALCERKFVPLLIATAVEMGINIPYPLVISAKNPGKMLSELVREIRISGLPSFVFIVFLDWQDPPPDPLHQILTCDWGIPFSLMAGTDLFLREDVDRDVINSILVDFNGKCGGVPSYSQIPLQATIAVGVVVDAQDAVSVVASLDHTFARYASEVASNVHDGIKRVLETAGDQFRTLVGGRPWQVIVYNLVTAAAVDVAAIVEAVGDQFDVVVCTVQEGVRSWSEQLRPGLLVSSGLTAPEESDFFLSTKDANLVKYSVVHRKSETEFRIDRFAMLTFHLTFNYPKAPGKSAKFPAPVMMALANGEFAAKYLNGREPAPSLRNSFAYFL